MKLTVTPVVVGRTAKLQVDKIDTGNGGNVVARCVLTAADPNLNKAALTLGVKYAALFDFIVNQYPKGVTELALYTKPVGETFRVRHIESSTIRAEHPTFEAALADAKAEADEVVKWDGTAVTCCLDVDFHDDNAPDPNTLRNACEVICPAPFMFWISKRGGAHLMFRGFAEYTADEVAAVAAYALRLRFPEAKYEFLDRTRTPPLGNTVYTRATDNDMGSIRRLLGEYPEGEYKEWLADRGYEVGRRYSHKQCPVDPRNAAEGNTDPVVVHEHHIYCYVCEKNGKRKGSKDAGVFPHAALAADRAESLIGNAVNNLVHWHDQARHYMATMVDNPEVARRIYRALLLARYPGDPRVDAVFTVASTNGLVRCDGYWTDGKGQLVPLKVASPILAALPHCQRFDREAGEVTTLPEAREWFSIAGVDHSARGYVPLHALRGVQLTQLQPPPRGKVYIVRDAKGITADNRPRYVHAKDRLPYAECVAVLQATLPGVDCVLLELLLAGRGCTEHRSGLPPMLFLTGPTSAGKTTHAQLAAAIAGDVFTGVEYTRDGTRLRQGLMAAKQEGAFVMFDEIFKRARAENVQEVVAMEALLTFTPESTSHALYIGQVRMGDLPLMLWADNTLPLAVRQHEQIGRRLHHYALHSSVDWEAPLREASMGSPQGLRTSGNVKLIEAANSFLSHVIDKWFPLDSAPTDFAVVARALDVPKMREGSAVAEKHETIREFFNAVCNAKPVDAAAKRPRGTVAVMADSADPVFPYLDACWSGDGERMQPVVSMIGEADLRKVCNLTIPAVFEIKKHGARFYVRFVGDKGQRVNSELRSV